MKRHRHNDIYVDAALVLLALLVAAAAGAVAKAEGILGPAHLCSSTGQVCAKELPNLYGVNGVGFVTTSTATAVDYGTGYGTGTGTGVGNVTYTLTGTGTATDTTSASDTAAISGNINTNTITVTTTATSTTVRTQTLTTVYTWQHNLTSTKTFVGTGTITATATATATITATITATATDFGTGTGTFTTTTTATATGTKSSVVSGTYAGTATCTGSWTNSTTMTYTGTWAQTATSTGTGTRTITVTLTQTGTVSATKTGTSTLSMSGTATHTGTDTTATASVTGTASGDATGTWTSTANTTATSTTVASNPTITYTTPLYSTGDLKHPTSVCLPGEMLSYLASGVPPSCVATVLGTGTAIGTTDYVTKKTSTGWGDSSIYDNGAIVGIGATSAARLTVAGDTTITGTLNAGEAYAGGFPLCRSDGTHCPSGGGGSGIGCSGTCSSPTWAVFSDSTHVTNASYTPEVSGAAATAVNGTSGSLAKFTGTHTVGNATGTDVINALGATPLYVSAAQVTPANGLIPISNNADGTLGRGWTLPSASEFTSGDISSGTGTWSSSYITAYLSLVSDTGDTGFTIRYTVSVQGTTNGAQLCHFGVFLNGDTSSPLSIRHFSSAATGYYWTVSWSKINSSLSHTDELRLRVASDNSSATCTMVAGSSIIIERVRN